MRAQVILWEKRPPLPEHAEEEGQARPLTHSHTPRKEAVTAGEERQPKTLHLAGNGQNDS